MFDYIEMFYNPKRKHVRNGMLSPVEFEKQQKSNPRVYTKLGAIHRFINTIEIADAVKVLLVIRDACTISNETLNATVGRGGAVTAWCS